MQGRCRYCRVELGAIRKFMGDTFCSVEHAAADQALLFARITKMNRSVHVLSEGEQPSETFHFRQILADSRGNDLVDYSLLVGFVALVAAITSANLGVSMFAFIGNLVSR